MTSTSRREMARSARRRAFTDGRPFLEAAHPLPRTPRRKITLSDLMILVAATACGIAWAQSVEPIDRESQIAFHVLWASPIVACWTAAVVVIRLRSPPATAPPLAPPAGGGMWGFRPPHHRDLESDSIGQGRPRGTLLLLGYLLRLDSHRRGRPRFLVDPLVDANCPTGSQWNRSAGPVPGRLLGRRDDPHDGGSFLALKQGFGRRLSCERSCSE